MFTYFAVIVFVAAMWAHGTRMISVMVVACLFGGSAAASLPGLGGAPLTPAVFALPFLLVHSVRTCGGAEIVRRLSSGPGHTLALMVAWGAFSAVVFPRVFQGETFVFTTDRNSFSMGVSLIPLRPNSTNITQTCYAIGGLATFVLVGALLGRDDGLTRFRGAVLLLAGLNCLAAFINLAEHFAGFPSVLEYVRNAQYGISNGAEEGGLLRISGTMPEASAFSALTVPLFAFTSCLWRNGSNEKAAGYLAAVLLGLLLFSTSTTAYASLIVYFTCLSLSAVWKLVRLGTPPVLGAIAIILWSLLASLCVVLLLNPELVDRVEAFFQITLFGKIQSASGVERSSWNSQALANFLDTYGLGAGLGSARASSFPLVLLSNLGIVGSSLFIAFFVRVFRRATHVSGTSNANVANAAMHAMFATLIAASFSGTVFELGMLFYAYAAAAGSAAGQCGVPQEVNAIPANTAHA